MQFTSYLGKKYHQRELYEKIECILPKVWPVHYVFDIKVVLGEPKPNQSQQGGQKEANCLSVQIF